MSKIIWESITEQGVIKDSHIVALQSVSGKEHAYEMYDADCQTYALSQNEYDSISEQIDWDDYIVIEAAGVKMWINEHNFTDALCNDAIATINGWDVNPMLVMELIKFIKADKERKAAKKAARKEAKALLKTPAGIDELIKKEKEKSAMKIAKLEKDKAIYVVKPEVMQ